MANIPVLSGEVPSPPAHLYVGTEMLCLPEGRIGDVGYLQYGSAHPADPLHGGDGHTPLLTRVLIYRSSRKSEQVPYCTGNYLIIKDNWLNCTFVGMLEFLFFNIFTKIKFLDKVIFILGYRYRY